MKKSNLEIVKNYLSGERPIIQIGYEPTIEKHKVGETWQDANGDVWQQRNGYKLRINEQADLIRSLTKRICKTCKREIQWGSALDEKLYKFTQNCSDCQIQEETDMRIRGVYKEYEQKKVLMNMVSYLTDVKREIGDRFGKLNNKVTFQNVVNDKIVDNEKWSDVDEKELRKVLRTDYRMVLEKIRDIEKQIKELDKKLK